jgi:hypothetical protein
MPRTVDVSPPARSSRARSRVAAPRAASATTQRSAPAGARRPATRSVRAKTGANRTSTRSLAAPSVRATPTRGLSLHPRPGVEGRGRHPPVSISSAVPVVRDQTMLVARSAAALGLLVVLGGGCSTGGSGCPQGDACGCSCPKGGDGGLCVCQNFSMPVCSADLPAATAKAAWDAARAQGFSVSAPTQVPPVQMAGPPMGLHRDGGCVYGGNPLRVAPLARRELVSRAPPRPVT